MGVGFGVGVGVMGVKVGVDVEAPGVSPSNRRFPSGVKVRIGTAIMILIDMNSRVIAIVRRIIYLNSFGPAGVVVGHAFESVCDTQDKVFSEEVAQQLQAYRQSIAETAWD